MSGVVRNELDEFKTVGLGGLTGGSLDLDGELADEDASTSEAEVPAEARAEEMVVELSRGGRGGADPWVALDDFPRMADDDGRGGRGGEMAEWSMGERPVMESRRVLNGFEEGEE